MYLRTPNKFLRVLKFKNNRYLYRLIQNNVSIAVNFKELIIKHDTQLGDNLR